jgi:ABC-type uncharacterized transport system substrate-binding protein
MNRARRAFLRRLSISFACLGTLSACEVVAPRQKAQATRVFRIVFLFTALTDPSPQASMTTVRRALSELGYIEGENVHYDGLDAERKPERFPALAIEVVTLSPDVIICQNPQAVLALKAATTSIPVIFVNPGVDPVEAGIVASLARPGGNITGISSAVASIAAKRLQLLKETVPSISRVAVLRDAAEPPQALAEMQVAARSLRIEIVPVDLRTAADLDMGLAAAVTANADAVMYTPTANFIVGTDAARRIGEFALQQRWPSLLAPAAGGLLNYAATLNDPWRRAAVYVDRILRGAWPGDLPVEGPAGSTFEINLCTAEKLGLTIPRSVLAQATAVLQCPR